MKKVNLGQLRDGLKKITFPKAQDATAKIIVKDKNLLSRKRDEMKAGVRPDGSIIGAYTSPIYAQFKRNLNPNASGNVDWILTGATVRSTYVKSLGDSKFIVTSDVELWSKLIGKYPKGEEIQTINIDVFNGLQKSIYAPQLNDALKVISGL